MSEYIEKGKLIDYVQDTYGGGNEDNTCIWYGDVIEMIRSEPAAEVMGDEYDLDKLRELAQADREGRCVVLPCRVGESLWVHDKDGKPREMELDLPDIRCHCREEDNLCMVLCSAKNTGVCAYRLYNDGRDIGKTVFLTKEAAEAALKGE